MMQQKVKTTRAPGLRLDKNRRLTPMQIYCWATVACLAVLLLALLASRGALLHRFFFYDVTDTGMDFFHSIEYMRGRMPYGQFDTLYPPLANLFFYVLYLLVPKTQSATWTESFISSLNMKGTERDLRLQQATMMLFIVFVIVVVLGIVSMTERLTRSCGGRKKLLAFCAVFSYGVLYGLESGNILLLCWPLIAFFILHRNSKNRFCGNWPVWRWRLPPVSSCTRRFWACCCCAIKTIWPRCARCCTVLSACASRCSSSMKDCLA